MSKTPSSEYTLSSLRVVVRVYDHDNRSSTPKSRKSFEPVKTGIGRFVISWINCLSSYRSPRYLRSLEKNLTVAGASHSCNVQPRVNHRLFRKAGSHVHESDSQSALRLAIETSDRKT